MLRNIARIRDLPKIPPNGLKLSLDANDANSVISSSGAVSNWNHQIGSSIDVAQATGSAQCSISPSHINGKTALTFDGSTEEFDLVSALSLTDAFTMFFVANNDETASTRTLFGNDASNNKIAVVNPTKAFARIIAAGSGDGNLNYLAESATGIQTVQRDSSNKVDMSFNGATLSRLYSDVAQSGTSVWNRIAIDDGTFNWQGDIARVLVYDRALSLGEIYLVHSILSREWGVVLS